MEDITPFKIIFSRFYKRLEKDEDFFNYYNISMAEATCLARDRAKGYLIDVLDKLTQIGNLQVNFGDYDEEIERINFKLFPNEIRLVVDIMFQEYMEKDIPRLHAFQINFSPSDINIITPSTERKTYLELLSKLKENNDVAIDNYKNRDRQTGMLRKTINYKKYEAY